MARQFTPAIDFRREVRKIVAREASFRSQRAQDHFMGRPEPLARQARQRAALIHHQSRCARLAAPTRVRRATASKG